MRRIGIFAISGLCLLLLVQLSSAKSAGKKVKGSSATLPISSSSPAARAAFEKGMVDYENLHLDYASVDWREAVKADPNFALAYAWIAFNSTDPVEVSAARQKAKALAPNVTPGSSTCRRTTSSPVLRR
jgi:hypothetical protein